MTKFKLGMATAFAAALAFGVAACTPPAEEAAPAPAVEEVAPAPAPAEAPTEGAPAAEGTAPPAATP